ncbi:beta-lactamase family protein [Streptomyces sp. PCS3-D2]|uniref:beta-lactamase family protein n=1 Tax=Streptomyces sp. PCS3-D2 TaxID=1460244 RepID=UPI001F472DE9|nr:beta-lactamase family protein [Streptomyces sp. PCS3-D2]
MTELNTSFAWSAGGMVSTAGDLNRFFAELLGGRLLPPAQQEEMFAVRPAPAGQWIPGASYGLGMSSMALSCGATVWGMGCVGSGGLSPRAQLTWRATSSTTKEVWRDWSSTPLNFRVTVRPAYADRS